MWKTKLIDLSAKVVPSIQKYRYVVIILLAGLLLMLVGTPRDAPDVDVQKRTDTQQVQGFDTAAFQEDLSDKLSLINGAGQVSLLLSMEDTEEVIYASNTKQTSTGENNVSYENTLSVLSDGSYGEQPVRVKSVFPNFRGAVVLCEGADDINVRLAITEAVATACGLSTDKITVLKMQNK